MADHTPTTGDLVKAEAIMSEDVDALIMAYGENPGASFQLFGTGPKLAVDAAITAHPTAPGILAASGMGKCWRRTMLHTAILMARPAKG